MMENCTTLRNNSADHFIINNSLMYRHLKKNNILCAVLRKYIYIRKTFWQYETFATHFF